MSGTAGDAGIISSCAGVEEEGWLLLLAAFIGCFVDDGEGREEVSLGDDTEPSGCMTEKARRYVLDGVRRALRYLVHDSDARRAKKGLEDVVDFVSEGFWRQRHSARRPCHRKDDDDVMNELSGDDTTRDEEEMLQLLDRLTGVLPHSTTTLNVVMPAELLYVVYYLAYTQCDPQAWQVERTNSRWVQLFFGLLPCADSTVVKSNRMNDFAASTALFSPHGHGMEPGGRLPQQEETRLHMKRLFSRFTAHGEAKNFLLFVDAYQAWLMRDYHGVLEHTEQLFQLLPFGEENQSRSSWVILQSSHFIYLFSSIAITNISHPTARDELKRRLQRVRVESNSDRYERYEGSVWGEGASLHTCPSLPGAVYNLVYCEISHSGENDHGEKEGDGCLHEEQHPQPSTLLECWQEMFLLTLRVWLRAKRLTEEGRMTDSRDLLLHTLERLYSHRCRISNNNSRSVITVFSPVPTAGATAIDSGGAASRGSGNDATKEDASISAGEGEIHVVILLMSSMWLRNLLLVNCAALSDTRTPLHFMNHLRQPLTAAELLYLAACPTLAAGGVHSPIFALFPIDGTGEMQPATGVNETLGRIPLPVRVPLLSHRLWRLRQQLLQELPRSPDENNECDDHRVSLQREMIHLCESLAMCARGLFGSLDLSFTDCAPHRIMFDAIMMACDVQEDILRSAALSLANASTFSPQTSPCSNSSRSRSGSYEERTGGIMSEVSNIVDTETNTNTMLTSYMMCTSAGDSPSFISSVTRVHDKSRSSIDNTSDNNNINEDNGDDNSDSWLMTNRAALLMSPSELSQASSFVACTAVAAQELYWFAYRKSHEWMEVLQQFFPHLPLVVQVCQLRVAAAAFDRGIARLARNLLAAFHENALVASHVALALFASLHVVPAERCIHESLQQHPHSAEIRRLYRVICGHNNISRQELQRHGDEEEAKGWVRKHLIRPDFTHRYRGVLPVKYVACEQRGYKAVYVPLVMSLVCIGVLVLCFVLHLRDVAFTTETTILKDDAVFRWSFALPSTFLTYLGFGVVLYALTAAVLFPFLASCRVGSNNRVQHVAMFLHALMEWNCLEDDTPNQFLFCLRGLPLVNLLTGVQLVVSNALWLKKNAGKLCISNDARIIPDECNRVFTGWGTVQLLVIVALLAIAVLFYGRAWRVIRYRDVLVGPLATFITIFFIDVAALLVFFPVIFLCCVLLEPLLFFISLVFSVAFATPLLTEHLPSVPTDMVLASTILPRTTRAVGCWGGVMAPFVEQVTSQIRARLRASMPPLHWFPSRHHDCSILCFHEVLQPLSKDGKDASNTTGGFILQFLRVAASRGIAVCAFLQDIVNWRIHRIPQDSEAAVQLALLRESFTAAVVPAPANVTSTLNDLWDATTKVELDTCATRFSAPPRWKVSSTTPYG
ncbi:hypothetical protein MOQ_000662 [Trypanosoma cruzi marinkellei]|uniref:Transmembrane protein n=1 Tax=Trypanosoma cruzi marinkellei TaxID=85056 RepID=K2NVV7_TRYCR|nr:hypothetical protein MOQ_000662 [Trypanosoma cruzi marinkellei]